MESMYSGLGPPEMLGLEMSLNHHPQQNPNSHLHLQHSNPQMVSFGGDPSHSQVPKTGYSSYTPKGGGTTIKQITLNSDDDEPGLNLDQDSANGSDGKMKNNNVNNTSPWQRMKWTDSMVKLLIMVVFYIGDEVSSDATDLAGKKKAGGGGGSGGGGVLQKKGKWKSVSKALMERGYCVSPQQCEDKFNDLNKRYKRVNDILGKGISCKVVENQSLLDQMDHLSQKLKDEVKKLLNSKHLFFKEMCAYHNSCGHGSGGGNSIVHPVIPAEKPSHSHHQSQSQEKCLHSTEGLKLPEYDDEDDNEDGLDEFDNNNNVYEEEDRHEDEERNQRKRARIGESDMIRQLSIELTSMIEDGRKSEVEKRHWLKGRLLSLEEKRVGFNVEAFELEKQRLKWVKFSGKKEREMEREKIKNERSKLETERMILMLRQKGLELAIQQPLSQYSSSSDKRRIEPSSTT